MVDPVGNQEGGAMYISCGDDGVAVEAEMGYVPNNPLFGLPLDSPQVNFEASAPALNRPHLESYQIDQRLTHNHNLLTTIQACSPSCSGCINCQSATSLPIQTLHGSDFDCGSCLDHNDILRSVYSYAFFDLAIVHLGCDLCAFPLKNNEWKD